MNRRELNEIETRNFWRAAQGLADARKTGNDLSARHHRNDIEEIMLHTEQSVLRRRGGDLLAIDVGFNPPLDCLASGI